MADHRDALQIEEEETFQREQALLEMEAAAHAQEQGVVEMERAFTKRARALNSLLGYVVEQGRSLRARAEAIGSRAVKLVEPLLADAGSEIDSVDFGMEDERQMMLERRSELIEIRQQLLEDREGICGQRHEALEGAETRLAEVEEALLAREMKMAGVLRKLITSSYELPEDDDDEGGGSGGNGGNGGGSTHHKERTSNVVGREPMTVISGDVDARKSHDASRRRRNRKPTKTSQVRFNLEARMGADEGHHFFLYEDDAGAELPGLFVATHNLLKEDREVSIAVGLGDDALVQAKGIVAWRRKAGEEDGSPGMGIELTWLEAGGRAALDAWLADNEPVVL